MYKICFLQKNRLVFSIKFPCLCEKPDKSLDKSIVYSARQTSILENNSYCHPVLPRNISLYFMKSGAHSTPLPISFYLLY